MDPRPRLPTPAEGPPGGEPDWARLLDAEGPDAGLVMDENFRVVWRSPSNARLTGVSDDEAIGTMMGARIEPGDLNEALLAVDAARRAPGTAVAMAFRLLTPTGSTRYVGWISDIDALRPGHMFVRFHRDDALHPADDDMRVSDPFVQMANGSTVGFAVLGRLGNITYRNGRFEEWFPTDSVVNLADMVQRVAPRQRPVMESWCQAANGPEVETDSPLPALTVELGDGTGPGRWLTVTMSRHELAPTIRVIGLTVQDVTEVVAGRNSLRQLIDLVPFLVFAIDEDGQVQFINKATGEFLGVDHVEVEGRHLPEVMGSDLANELVSSASELIATGTTVHDLSDVVVAADGSERFLRTSLIPFTGEGTGRPTLLAVCEDVTDRVRNEALISALGRNMLDLAMVLDARHHAVFVSDSVESLLGWTPEEFTSRNPEDVVHDGDLHHIRTLQDPSSSSPGTVHTAEVRLLHRDGTWRWFELRTVNLTHIASISGVLVFGRDISDRKVAESRLRHEATHDNLTSLMNRVAIIDSLERALGRARTHGTPVGALFVDIDNFKLVNDGLGHDAGDRLLQLVAEVLTQCTRPGDSVGRLGGDEFLVVAPEVVDQQDLLDMARRIQEATTAATRGIRLPVTLSIGACLSPTGDTTAQAMVRTADAAMYRAKAAGKARAEIFHTDEGDSAARRLDVGRLLDTALSEGTFTVHFQPVFRREGSLWRLAALEALARCPVPGGGWLSPEEFVPLAEQTGMITRMGQRVTGLTVRELQRWHAAGHPVTAWVNLSMAELSQPGLHNQLVGAVRRAGLPPSAMGVEVTESVFGESLHHVIDTLSGLRDAGFTVLIDDFGTGYSGLGAIKSYPIDLAKIDRSFCAGLLESEADVAIVESVVRIGAAMGFEVVAEGVETPDLLAALAGAGCQYAQGWVFERPMPAAEVDGHLDRWAKGITLEELDPAVQVPRR